MQNRKKILDEIDKCGFFKSFRNHNLIGEFVLGSDILDLSTEKSDLDLLFLYNQEEKKISSYDFNSKRCSVFLVIGGKRVQWKISSVMEIKNALLEKERDRRDFSLLASLVKIGITGAEITNISPSNTLVLEHIWANRKKISICALHSFLESHKAVYPNNVEKAFENKKMSAASSVVPKFWYTAFLGYNLLFDGSYNIELIKELKDFAYGQETALIKENEQDIINKVKACYEYYEKNFPNGVDKLVESVYNNIIEGN